MVFTSLLLSQHILSVSVIEALAGSVFFVSGVEVVSSFSDENLASFARLFVGVQDGLKLVG